MGICAHFFRKRISSLSRGCWVPAAPHTLQALGHPTSDFRTCEGAALHPQLPTDLLAASLLRPRRVEYHTRALLARIALLFQTFNQPAFCSASGSARAFSRASNSGGTSKLSARSSRLFASSPSCFRKPSSLFLRTRRTYRGLLCCFTL